MIFCENKRPATLLDLKPGMIVHNVDCSIAIMALAVTPHEVKGDEVTMDWSTGKPLQNYPAMAYLHRPGNAPLSSTGYYPLLSSSYHLAEVQRLEEAP